jgi:hypothetical protein
MRSAEAAAEFGFESGLRRGSGRSCDTGRSISLGRVRITRNPSISHVIAPAKLMAIHTQ